MITYEEAVDLVVKAIIDSRKFALQGDEAKVFVNEDNGLLQIYPRELNVILLRLQNEEKVIKTHVTYEYSTPAYDVFEEIYYPIEVLGNFDQWQADYWSRRRSSNRQSVDKADQGSSESEIVYRITYTKSREVLLNNNIQIGKPIFNSENDLVFSFLYENPNRTISLSQLQGEANIRLSKDFDKIVENLGFKGDIRKIFFSVSKNTILFRNPITKRDLEELGITRIKIREPRHNSPH